MLLTPTYGVECTDVSTQIFLAQQGRSNLHNITKLCFQPVDGLTVLSKSELLRNNYVQNTYAIVDSN